MITVRVYHHYKKWEDHKNGFYNNCVSSKKKEMLKKVLEMFNSEELTKKYMIKVVNEWKNSCEHNFTNPSLNRIAYLGQAACCLFCGIPSTVTMEAWSLLDKKIQQRSDKIALEIIDIWFKSNRWEQLCLNLD